ALARLMSVTNADMGFSFCETNGLWAHSCRHKLYLSCGFSVPRTPSFCVTLGTKKVKQSGVFGLRTRGGPAFNALLKAGSANWSVDGEVFEKEFEFKPSFEEYLKVMESVRTVREKRQTHSSKRHKLDNAEISKMEDFEGQSQEGVTSREGYFGGRIDCEERGSRELKDVRMGFEEKENSRSAQELAGKESKKYAKINANSDMVSRNGKWERMNTNGGQVSQRNGELEEHSFKTDKGVFKGTKMQEGNYSQVETVPDEKVSLRNVKLIRRNKLIAERSNDQEVVVERVAFKSLEEFNDVVDKPRLSRNEMEERVQKLARW
ncbi:hypothetical protein U1Q18_048340, partial [Sarracenia purpurea var. burkii]